MEQLNELTGQIAGVVWGLHTVFILFGAGLLFTLYFGFPQVKYFLHSIQVARGKYDRPEDAGEITHFQALCAALSATIGLGNIAGVAVAISVGGPGAVFWMWVAGGLGMATKFTSVSLSLMHREVKVDGVVHGGPMYTMKHGLGKTGLWRVLAAFYASCVVLSSFGAGNMFQSNQLAAVVQDRLSIPVWVSGMLVAVLAGMVLIGGIRRIGHVAGKLVPFMVIIYVAGAIGIIIYDIDRVPDLIYSIFHGAFFGTAAVGGFSGVAVREVVVQGVRRAVFSNEAGMGSAAIAHSAAKSTPIQEGVVALLEPFIDTIVVCTMTALVMLITGVWNVGPEGPEGAALTAVAFETLYGSLGGYVVMLAIILFAFSTMISWSYYGEQGMTFLFGERSVTPFRYVFILFIFIGAVWTLTPVLNVSDSVFALLAIPNLLANVFLRKKLRQESASYHADLKAGKLEIHH